MKESIGLKEDLYERFTVVRNLSKEEKEKLKKYILDTSRKSFIDGEWCVSFYIDYDFDIWKSDKNIKDYSSKIKKFIREECGVECKVKIDQRCPDIYNYYFPL